MNLANLKPVVTALLGQGTSTSNLTIGSTDMFLVAANNARRNAELLHNFELARVEGTLSIDGSTGGSLDDVVFTDTTGTGLFVSGTLTPDVTGFYTYGGTANGQSFYYKIVSGVLYVIFYNVTEYQLINNFAGTPLWVKTVSVAGTPTGTYAASTGATGTATVEAGESIKLKEVVAVSRSLTSGLRIPLPFMGISAAIAQDRVVEESTGFYMGHVRYPTDADVLARNGCATIAQRGRMLYIRPQQSVDAEPLEVIIEGYKWLPEYTAAMVSDTNATAQDFLLEYGTSYMQWAIVCELNYMLKNFVPRTEGNLSPPEQAREDAWRRLLLWDSYMIDSHSNRSL